MSFFSHEYSDGFSWWFLLEDRRDGYSSVEDCFCVMADSKDVYNINFKIIHIGLIMMFK
jgi:hypothetical protein